MTKPAGQAQATQHVMCYGVSYYWSMGAFSPKATWWPVLLSENAENLPSFKYDG